MITEKNTAMNIKNIKLKNKMRNKTLPVILLFFFIILALMLFVMMDTTKVNAEELNEAQINIKFYYGSTCPHCANMESIFEEISSDYNLNIKAYEIYSNNANRLALIQEYENFGYDANNGGVPTTVIEDRIMIVGELSEEQLTLLLDTISKKYSYELFKEKIPPAYKTPSGDIFLTASSFDYSLSQLEKILKQETDDNNNENNTSQNESTSPITNPRENTTNFNNNSNNENNANQDNQNNNQNTSILTWSVLIPAALIDSINPCTFAVMVILLAAVLLSKGKKHVLWSGLSFTLAIFISYVLMGFGIFSLVSNVKIQNAFYIFITILAFIMAFFEIKSYFKYKAGFEAVEMPLFMRPTLKKLMRFVDSPITAFIMGFVCSLFLLPCSSGPYLMVLGLIAKQTTTLNLMYLIVYNLIFILPLLLITLLVSFGVTTVNHIHRKKEKYIRHIHLISGILILLIINFLTTYLIPILRYIVLSLVTIFEIVVIILLIIRYVNNKK